MLEQFKTFNKDRLDLDEMVALAAYGRNLRDEYERQRVDEPEWVGHQLKVLRHEIAAKVADKIEARKNQLKSQLKSLRTPAERREDLEKELAALEAPVGA